MNGEPNIAARTALERCYCAVTPKHNLVKESGYSPIFECDPSREMGRLYIDMQERVEWCNSFVVGKRVHYGNPG